MQPTFFINHGGGRCFFLEPGPMRATWSELETYLRGFMATLSEMPCHPRHLGPFGRECPDPGTVHFHGHALGKPISGFRFG